MSVYLGEKGITSTSANYLANLAKEVVKEAEAKLDNISFVNKFVELINAEKQTPVRVGITNIEDIEVLLIQIANMHSFCAWVREAIKEKEHMLDVIETLNIDQFALLKGITVPVAPTKPTIVTETDILNEMNIKERNNYLRLEAFAATFGKYIHPGGKVAAAREDMLYHINVPNEVEGEGRDMVIYSYVPAKNSDDVNKAFLALQSRHRDYEKQLNAIKFHIKEEVNKRNSIAQTKFKEEYERYSDEIQKIRQAMTLYINNGRENIANMKIVIPEKLQDTYEYLNSLGNENKN